MGLRVVDYNSVVSECLSVCVSQHRRPPSHEPTTRHLGYHNENKTVMATSTMNILAKGLLQRTTTIVGASRPLQLRAVTFGAPLGVTSSNLIVRETPSSKNNSPALCATRCFSSTGDSSTSTTSYNPLDWWRKRQTQKEQEKFEEKTIHMASLQKWTLGEMHQEMVDSLDWKSKIPGISGTKEVKDAKAVQKLVEALMEVVGKDASDEDLAKLKKVEKLRAANKAGKTIQEMNTFFDQFEIMCMMQRVLRKRKLEGRTLPMTQESLQMVMQAEGPRVMSKAQRDKMIKRAGKQYSSLGK